MAVDKWKPSATAFCVLCCILIILPNAFVNSVRVQGKRVKGVKGESILKFIELPMEIETCPVALSIALKAKVKC